MEPPDRDEAISFLRAALAVRPRNTEAHNTSASPCGDRGSWTRPSPATARPSKSTRQMPQATTSPSASFWHSRRSWTRPSPLTARPSNSTRNTPPLTSFLGIVLRDQKKLDEAIAAYRKAIDLDPKYADAHMQPRQRPARPEEAGRGHRRLSARPSNRPEIRYGLRFPRRPPARPEEAGRGHRLLPQGDRGRPQRRPSPHPTWPHFRDATEA